MFHFDPNRKRFTYSRKRRHTGRLEKRPGRVRRGMLKGSVDTRWLRCYRLKCRLLRSPKCPWCASFSYVPSRLKNEYRPRSKTSAIDNKLGSLMKDLQEAQEDSFYDSLSDIPSMDGSTTSKTGSVATVASHTPAFVTRAKEQFFRLTARLWGPATEEKKTNEAALAPRAMSQPVVSFASERVVPRLRRSKRKAHRKRVVSNPPLKTKRVAYR